MTNDEIIKWIETIKAMVDNVNVLDPKDFNDIKNCCDDFIHKVKDKDFDTSWKYWMN
ncbi:hypothetical protein [Apilactobacillus kunkeei]|uniref:hypothetical protein n=1 Tax=Apilactobacillus kunkeei TaxID=148814 RepID=UPI000A6A98AB|nr:hypothetical protein [Apilactobacillus kunkeei]CAI2684166.1 hypothetical protein AKUFHON2_09200 [Apilactobacillus kunkeei]